MLNRVGKEKEVLFWVGIFVVMIIKWMNSPQVVRAQETTSRIAPSAIIEMEEEAVCVSDGRGYYYSERKAKITIIDELDFFDENSAENGIKVSRRNANGDILPISSEDLHISEWTHRGNLHTVEVVFGSDGNYTWELIYTNLQGMKLEKISTGRTETPFQFTIDREPPKGVVRAVSTEGTECTWDVLKNETVNGMFSKDEITVNGEFQDDTDSAGVKVFYYKVDKSVQDSGSVFLTTEELDTVSSWKEFRTLKITKDQSCVIYLKVMDMVGNYTYINTGLLTIDKQSPVIETLTAQAENNSSYINGIFSGDVTIALKVSDPTAGNTSTGIQVISYQVYNMGKETQSGVLYDASKTDVNTKLLSGWQGQFLVNSHRNNSNDVVVVIWVQDVAGNVKTERTALKIDISAPTIQVSYDNNDASNQSYFSSKRTATIVIRERNFNSDDVSIKVTNTESVIPQISEWTCRRGSGNQDNTEWVAQITYEEEGDYSFRIEYCDLAGNKNTGVDYRDSASPTKFTIDSTPPIVRVVYDNMDEKTQNYYNQMRTATIEIEEHNLDLEDVKIDIIAPDGVVEFLLPKIGDWKKDGDSYVTTIVYDKDGTYEFDINVLDKAGNQSQDYKRDIFHIDMVFPSAEIIGVADNSSNNGDIFLEIICTDQNFSVEQVMIKLTDIAGNEVQLNRNQVYLMNGIQYVYENVPTKQHMDGHYELYVSVIDLAGNLTEKKVKFSVNRFGSSYHFSEDTEKINNAYMQTPSNVVVKEINVDLIDNQRILLFKNEKVILLKEEEDYFVELEFDEYGRYWYTYTILKDNFTENGTYQISISSEDVAGNLSDNNMEGKDSSLRFGVDTIKPILVVYNLEDKKVYESDRWTVQMSAKDNFSLSKVQVYLDKKIYKTWNAQDLRDVEERNGVLTFDISGNSIKAHQVEIVCVDEAGNEYQEKISGFYVTTNSWVHLWKNKDWICGILLAILSLGLLIFRIVYKNRSNSLLNFEK